ncbi:MAG: hypothetical protein A3G33_03230 [Omnitrophica bacterium RIFCSPLOWO2_12_FULL_44_17]|uniref:Glycosyltransferase RgtA/B/C/D-like domain-containing protein n=1 Tax=Candidatus Danuiimicrobium aquiferis TaxID=1801832 RepID=A0A1G1KU74_9BACT|nr:MAG: hypothetical protein A3B72_06775 [Omnitrophica bacterium RIFCSPHIGHO2_02_FULL_45_28]OGW88533.1 MAG: hypothetical protein A3E74_02025 [Omnitrophica bacterium RIFCSPHIGHO2_12_FULL_44_12]OGW96332.1 MAG: hypothetical protein A3G33_03230 [Omnitrophica bacterium RIFCSPLOWO2_12_FULL_44_17]OGX04860.1 MAG: hypothetical protein A3J12_07905 [Omnitrophica bacterium RIFCSPLOWO2_02_FULL_44_11]
MRLKRVFENTKVFDIAFQLFLLFCLYVALTGGVFFVGWRVLKRCRDLFTFLPALTILGGSIVSYYLYIKNSIKLENLEPIKTINRFFLWPPFLSVAILYIWYSASQTISLFLKHASLETALWDFGFYEQVIWNTAHGDFLVTSVRGGLHIFCEHFKPILALLSPIYIAVDNSTFFLAITTLVMSSSIIATYLIAKTVINSHKTALVFSLCVCFYLPIRDGINFPFHTQMMADPFILFGFYCALTKKNAYSLLCFALALICKENIAMDVLGVGLFLTFQNQNRKNGLLTVMLSLACLVLILAVIEPNFSYPYHFINKWSYFAHFKSLNPELWKKLLEPNPISFLILVFGPFLFLSFKCKGWFWLLGPSITLRLLSGMPGFRFTRAHYTGGFNALVIISAIYGFLSLIQSLKANNKSTVSNMLTENKSLLYVLLILGTLAFAGAPQLFTIDKYLDLASNGNYQKVIKILESTPNEYSALTSERFAAHLSRRRYLFVFFEMFLHTPFEKMAETPDLIFIDSERMRPREIKEVDKFVTNGYAPIFQTEYMQVYARPGVNKTAIAELTARWNTMSKTPEIPYRSSVRFWYKWLVGCALALITTGLLRTRRVIGLSCKKLTT